MVKGVDIGRLWGRKATGCVEKFAGQESGANVNQTPLDIFLSKIRWCQQNPLGSSGNSTITWMSGMLSLDSPFSPPKIWRSQRSAAWGLSQNLWRGFTWTRWWTVTAGHNWCDWIVVKTQTSDDLQTKPVDNQNGFNQQDATIWNVQMCWSTNLCFQTAFTSGVLLYGQSSGAEIVELNYLKGRNSRTLNNPKEPSSCKASYPCN